MTGWKQDEPLKVIGLAEIRNFPKPSWLIENILLRNSVTLLCAYVKIGKSYLMKEMGRCVALGEDFLGTYKTEKGSVLYVDQENDYTVLSERWDDLDVPSEAPINYLSFQRIRIDNIQSVEKLKAVIQELQPTLIVFDTLTRFHTKKENEAGEMGQVMHEFTEISRLGHTVVVLHHDNKIIGKGKTVRSARGSGDIVASVSSCLSLDKFGPKDNETFILEMQANRVLGIKEKIYYKMAQTGAGTKIKFVPHNCILESSREISDAVKEVLGEEKMGFEEIRKGLKAKEYAAGRDKLRDVLKDRDIFSCETIKNKHLYFTSCQEEVPTS